MALVSHVSKAWNRKEQKDDVLWVCAHADEIKDFIVLFVFYFVYLIFMILAVSIELAS